MTATDQMRAMLDQLMGTARNGDNKNTLKFSDGKVCKSFLIGCCPHDILASTSSVEALGIVSSPCATVDRSSNCDIRMDLGECPKIHDLALRADYEIASKDKDFYYDIEAMDHLQAFISDCDHRTEAAKKRLAETQEELTAEVAAKANAVHAFAEEIGKKLAKAEQLGEAGEVEESIKLMGEIEELRAKKIKAEHEYRSSMPASTYQQQKLRVCEVCSAYLGIHDNDIRLADHFGGKLHLGFMVIREKLAELEKTAGPRKSELKKTGNQRGNDRKSRYFVGGRELDRRSRVHRSRSNDRAKNGGGSTGGGADGGGGSGGGGGDKRVDERKGDRRGERRDRDNYNGNRGGGGGGGGGGGRDRRRQSRSRSRSRSRDRDRERYNRRRSHSRERDRGGRDRDRERGGDRDRRDRNRR